MKKIPRDKRKSSRSYFRLILGVCGLVLLICLGSFFVLRSRPVWIVEDRYVEVWEKILVESPSPLLKAKVIPRSAEAATLPRSQYGYRIGSGSEAQASTEDESPVRVYRGLRSGSYGDALLLAVDPWLVFRQFTSLPLTREEVENGPAGRGRIFTAGSDRVANRAWTAQLLQEAPGIFPPEREIWEQTGERLFLGRRFQSGALTYTWNEVWPHLLGDDESVRVYAPLSLIRTLPVYETNVLEADVFPGRSGWNEFGLQTEILWATPYGSQKNRERLKPVETWLRSAKLQSLLSDTLGWIAVHPEAPPYNPVSGSARVYWLTASYVWEMTGD